MRTGRPRIIRLHAEIVPDDTAAATRCSGGTSSSGRISTGFTFSTKAQRKAHRSSPRAASSVGIFKDHCVLPN